MEVLSFGGEGFRLRSEENCWRIDEGADWCRAILFFFNIGWLIGTDDVDGIVIFWGGGRGKKWSGGGEPMRCYVFLNATFLNCVAYMFARGGSINDFVLSPGIFENLEIFKCALALGGRRGVT